VLSAAEELGYVGPDPTARALARGTTGAIGVLLTDALSYAFSDEVSTIFLAALVDALSPTGMAVTLLTSNNRQDIVPARDVAIDGAIVYSCRPTSAARDWLVRRKLPLVYVDQEPVVGAPSVNVDDRGGARAAAEHVIELGHRDVGILTIASEGAHPERQRMLGWRDALRAVGLEPTVATTSTNLEDDAVNAALEILTPDRRPTALLCFSDVAALGALRAAVQLGLDVPRDLSIVGFDDSPVARRSHPALTTVRQDLVAKGRLAADSLVSVMVLDGSRSSARGRHHMLPTELVIRETSGPAPRG
jgi:DNA-binding LacI/PurR family transcriptional regulator